MSSWAGCCANIGPWLSSLNFSPAGCQYNRSWGRGQRNYTASATFLCKSEVLLSFYMYSFFPFKLAIKRSNSQVLAKGREWLPDRHRLESKLQGSPGCVCPGYSTSEPPLPSPGKLRWRGLSMKRCVHSVRYSRHRVGEKWQVFSQGATCHRTREPASLRPSRGCSGSARELASAHTKLTQLLALQRLAACALWGSAL